MFGIIADILTSTTSVLFPVFASYKALKTSDPAQIKPWLMYWTTMSLVLAGESFLHPILSWVPFYSWMRLGLHLYLVLPGNQGSVYIYQAYIQPYLEEHERSIDDFISDGHDKAKKAGLQYLKQAIEYVKVNVLGMPARRPTPPPSRNASYAQTLLSRFNMPSARDGLATAGATDIFAMLGQAIQQSTYPTSQSRDAQAEDLSASGTLIPPQLSGDERSNYISLQRDRLRTLLQAFDKEAYDEEPGYPIETGSSSSPPKGPPHQRRTSDHMKKSRSETDFEDLGDDDLPTVSEQDRPAVKTSNSGWSKWIWGNYGEKDSAIIAKKDA